MVQKVGYEILACHWRQFLLSVCYSNAGETTFLLLIMWRYVSSVEQAVGNTVLQVGLCHCAWLVIKGRQVAQLQPVIPTFWQVAFRLLDSGWAQTVLSAVCSLTSLLFHVMQCGDLQPVGWGKVGLCSGHAEDALQHPHQQNHTDMNGWCSDTAGKKSSWLRAPTLLQPDFRSVPPSEGQWEESLLHQLAFCSSLELKPTSLRLNSTFSSAGNTKERKREEKKVAAFCALSDADPCIFCVRRGAISFLQFCFCVVLLIITRKEDYMSLKWYDVFAVGSCFWHCSSTSYLPHLFPIQVRSRK